MDDLVVAHVDAHVSEPVVEHQIAERQAAPADVCHHVPLHRRVVWQGLSGSGPGRHRQSGAVEAAHAGAAPGVRDAECAIGVTHRGTGRSGHRGRCRVRAAGWIGRAAVGLGTQGVQRLQVAIDLRLLCVELLLLGRLRGLCGVELLLLPVVLRLGLLVPGDHGTVLPADLVQCAELVDEVGRRSGFEQRRAGAQRGALVRLDHDVLHGRVRRVHAGLQWRQLGRERGLRGLGGLELLGDLVVLLDDLFQAVLLGFDLRLQISWRRGGGRHSHRQNDADAESSDEHSAHQCSRNAQGLQSSLPVRGPARPGPRRVPG